LDLGTGVKPPGYYVRRETGLFPTPYPPDHVKLDEVVERFRVLGIFLAKALQDGRLVDMPLSKSFCKLLCGRRLVAQDLCDISPSIGRVVLSLQDLANEKRVVDAECETKEDCQQAYERLRVAWPLSDVTVSLEEVGLTMVYLPPSRIYGFSEHELRMGGADELITLDNLDTYLELLTSFILRTGIERQLNAFRDGFCTVFPLDKLSIFTPDEIPLQLCGDQNIEWTIEELLSCTEPKHGYTLESPTYQQLLHLLTTLDTNQKKAFLLFATGCPTLPPGGLRNLHPRMTIVRKSAAENPDGMFPSVNTCAHYLKLPEYSSVDIMKERLLVAITTRGFHLN